MKAMWIAVLALALSGTPVAAREGMFTPGQLPEIADDLKATGLELDPAELTDLTGFPMGAVISLGGCTASFVSPIGLAVTNHHCARGSIQYNSTPQANYLEDGFLASNLAEEVPAAPGTRIFVTVDVRDVTDEVRAGLDGLETGREVFDTIETRRKALIAECERRDGHRCQVASFHGGASYRLIDRLELRDVRLVYAPGDSIGRYGGDVDNWKWPRHTGDFAFYRAYVAPDGSSADFAPENVPYQPPHVLRVSSGGLEAGDFVMAIGYPGQTSRYARLPEVTNTFEWQYPAWQTLLADWIAAIEAAAPAGTDARIKYESRLAALNNFAKNLTGQMAGAERVGLIDRRAAREAALMEWARTQDDSETLLETLAALDRLSEQMAAADRRDFWFDQIRRPQLLSAARRLYRLSREREKPDAEREPGYQERDMTFLRQSLEAIDRRFDPAVDKAEWLVFLKGYLAQPAAARVPAFDRALGISDDMTPNELAARLEPLYAQTMLGDTETRLALMSADAGELEASEDPFLRLAVALYDTERELDETGEELAGRMARLRPIYMTAILDWQRDQGGTAYPDANSTLRVTYGTVMGGTPADYAPFTRLEDIPEKNTGEAPFDAPARQIELIEAGSHGPWASETLGTVPVNFLSDLDVTGGNSGSPTLNARGELVGLLFDTTLESVNSDWDFDPETTRAIHVDSRYMLWVMDKVDGAGRVVGEMTLVGSEASAAPATEPEPPIAEPEPDTAPAVAPMR